MTSLTLDTPLSHPIMQDTVTLDTPLSHPMQDTVDLSGSDSPLSHPMQDTLDLSGSDTPLSVAATLTPCRTLSATLCKV